MNSVILSGNVIKIQFFCIILDLVVLSFSSLECGPKVLIYIYNIIIINKFIMNN